MFFSDPASTSEQRTELMQRVVNSLDGVASDARGKVEGKEIILVIGGTGAGKSTFINYLAGRTMRPVTGVGLELCVEAENPISEIGHGHNSITKAPKVFTDERGLTYCDCPGLFDTEGTEAEIRNIFSIKYIASFAASVKAVVLIFNYHSLLSERVKNIRETMNIVHKFFGERTRNYLPSIHVIVSRVTDGAVMSMSASGLTQHLRDGDDVLNSLIENGRVGFYDPLNRAPAGSGALTRDTLLQVFRSSTAITRFNEVIRVSLSSDSINALGGVIRFVKTTAIEDFERGDFDRVNSKIVSTERLRVLGVSVVSDVFGDMIGTLNEKIRRLDSLDTLQRIKEKITNPVLSEATNERMIEIREQIRQREEAAAALRAAAEAAKRAEAARRAEEEARKRADEELQRERNKPAPPPTVCQCQCHCDCGGCLVM